MLIAVILLLAGMVLLLMRATKGPTPYDRFLAVNSFGTKTVVVIVLLAVLVDDPMFLDVALVYALVNFITTIALLKYVRYRSLGRE